MIFIGLLRNKKNVCTETLKKESRSVVFEKHQLENQNQSMTQIFPAFVVHQDSNAVERLSVFQANTP